MWSHTYKQNLEAERNHAGCHHSLIQSPPSISLSPRTDVPQMKGNTDGTHTHTHTMTDDTSPHRYGRLPPPGTRCCLGIFPQMYRLTEQQPLPSHLSRHQLIQTEPSLHISLRSRWMQPRNAPAGKRWRMDRICISELSLLIFSVSESLAVSRHRRRHYERWHLAKNDLNRELYEFCKLYKIIMFK